METMREHVVDYTAGAYRAAASVGWYTRIFLSPACRCTEKSSHMAPYYSVSEATERRGPCGRVLGNVLGAVAPVTLGLVPLVPPTLHSCTFQLPPSYIYIVRRFTTGSPIDGTHWLPNKEMTKLWEVSDETSTDRFPHFQCLTLQCDTSTLSLRSGG